MGFLPGSEYIVKNKKGQIWNFYLNEKEYIEYITTDENIRWAHKSTLFTESTQSFSIEIDIYDRIHVLSYHSNGDIFYHLFDANQWSHQLLMTYDPAQQEIYYPTIKIFKGKVHLFYYLVHTLTKSKASLLHIYYGNNEWSKNHILNMEYTQFINPFKLLTFKDQLYILFSSLKEKYDQFFITSYEAEENRWSKNIQLTDTLSQKVYLDGLMDSNGYVHLIWSRFDEESLQVYYQKHFRFYDQTQSVPILLSQKSNCSFPTLIFYNNVLWAIWTQMNKLFSCYSIDNGNTWSSPQLRDESKAKDFRRYRFLSHGSERDTHIICDFVYGSVYPTIQFIGFGGDLNDEVPTSE